jgi:aminoacrylate peracid reductase
MSKEEDVIIPKGSAPPLAPFWPGVRAGNAVYVSGMVPMDSAGKTIAPGDAKAETPAVLQAIKAVLEAAGPTIADVVFGTIILKDFAD